MNNEPKIITGLRLSEAIKYLEENEGALIRPDGSTYSFSHMNDWSHYPTSKQTYSVKLPPPKTVPVTESIVCDAFDEADIVLRDGDYQGAKKRLCKALGL